MDLSMHKYSRFVSSSSDISCRLFQPMLSPPSSPPYHDSDNRFDLMSEIESMDIASTTTDPHLSGADIDTQGQILHSDASPVTLHGITGEYCPHFLHTID